MAFTFGHQLFVLSLGCQWVRVIAVDVYPPTPAATLQKSLEKVQLIADRAASLS